MADRQEELLQKEDWRFFAIDKLGTGLAQIATTERLLNRQVAHFGLPSAPALFLSMAFGAHRQRSSIKIDNLFDKHPPPQGTWPDNHSPLFDYFEAAIAEVICSFSAIEAAANETIPKGYSYQRPVKPGEAPVTLSAGDIERYVSLDEKLKRVLPHALNQTSPAGGRLWQPYLKLKRLRDGLIHLKAADRTPSGPDKETIWGRLLRMGDTVYPNVAADMIGHFYNPTRRWFKIRPIK